VFQAQGAEELPQTTGEDLEATSQLRQTEAQGRPTPEGMSPPQEEDGMRQGEGKAKVS